VSCCFCNRNTLLCNTTRHRHVKVDQNEAGWLLALLVSQRSAMPHTFAAAHHAKHQCKAATTATIAAAHQTATRWVAPAAARRTEVHCREVVPKCINTMCAADTAHSNPPHQGVGKRPRLTTYKSHPRHVGHPRTSADMKLVRPTNAMFAIPRHARGGAGEKRAGRVPRNPRKTHFSGARLFAICHLSGGFRGFPMHRGRDLSVGRWCCESRCVKLTSSAAHTPMRLRRTVLSHDAAMAATSAAHHLAEYSAPSLSRCRVAVWHAVVAACTTAAADAYHKGQEVGTVKRAVPQAFELQVSTH
jgi:hypothetical protein